MGRVGKPHEPVEIRRNPDQSIDEICIDGGNVHIEQMDDSSWFTGVEAKDGSYWQFWFGAKNRKSHVEFSHTETITAEENREIVRKALTTVHQGTDLPGVVGTVGKP